MCSTSDARWLLVSLLGALPRYNTYLDVESRCKKQDKLSKGRNLADSPHIVWWSAHEVAGHANRLWALASRNAHYARAFNC